MTVPPSPAPAGGLVNAPTLPGLDGDEVRLVTVAVLAPVPHPLTYFVPPSLPLPAPGSRVLCPLGPREVTGVVIPAARASAATPEGLRPISEVLDEQPLWSADLMDTVKFCADYYLAPLGEVARAALPPGLAPRSARQWRITAAGKLALAHPEVTGLSHVECNVLAFLADKPRTPEAVHKALGVSPGRMARLASRGLVDDEREVKGRAKADCQDVWFAVSDPDAKPLPPRAKALLTVDAYLHAVGHATAEDLAARFVGAPGHLKKLAALGRARCESRPRTLSDPYANFPAPPAPATEDLTGAQREAIDQIATVLREGLFKGFLLEGVTGSGKTEVYLQSIAVCRKLGKTALVLVPEIALTPALAARFRGRVEGGVAVLHSGLSPSDRLSAYDAARHGRVGAVLGARSAIFAPLWNLGLIVVDEEHEGSYKQEESPRYQARDLALFRARAAAAACVLGSATPSLESAHSVHIGKLTELRLPGRPNARPMPAVELVDLRRKKKGVTVESPDKPKPAKGSENKPLTVGSNVPILSPRLLEELDLTLQRHEQALIFLNRRGYSSAVLCVDCGVALSCPNCAVALTHHAPPRTLAMGENRPAGFMRCHYCDHNEPVPLECPSCRSMTLGPMGLGIQRVEAEVAARFPNARIGRLDRDSVRQKGALERTLTQFASRKLDVLVGTQMLAKGHDYPGVTLVGVVAADVGLRIPDWRAAERTLQLLTQVAGRAGRGDQPGRVLIQTYCPEHEALTCAAHHDVRGFIAGEMTVRRELGYPPFGRVALLRAESKNESQALQVSQQAASELRAAAAHMNGEVTVLGPAPAPLARLREIYRFQVLVKATGTAPRATVLNALRRNMESIPAGARLVIDVDPGMVM